MKKVFVLTLAAIIVLASVGLGEYYGYRSGYRDGFQNGQIYALNQLPDQLVRLGLDWQFTLQPDGSYLIRVFFASNQSLVAEGKFKIDVYVTWMRGSILLSSDRHSGLLTDIGKLEIQHEIGSGVTPHNTTKYISVSATDISGYTTLQRQRLYVLPSEINTNGFTRATGNYLSTGNATWNISYTFTSTGTQTIYSYGANWSPTSQSSGNLMATDYSSAKNTAAGDNLLTTWVFAITGV